MRVSRRVDSAYTPLEDQSQLVFRDTCTGRYCSEADGRDVERPNTGAGTTERDERFLALWRRKSSEQDPVVRPRSLFRGRRSGKVENAARDLRGVVACHRIASLW